MGDIFISEFFDLGDSLERLGVFDSIVNKDSHFFINILRLKKATTPEFVHSYKSINDFFAEIMFLLETSSEKGDKFYRAALKKFYFNEVNGINLGFSESGAGSGFGSVLSKQVISDAYEIVKTGSKQPQIFQLVGLFEENVAADRLSDMIATLIIDDIRAYTKRINVEVGINADEFPEISFVDGVAINPYKNCELLYLPTEILHELPIAREWSDIDRVIAENEAIRNEVNDAIGNEWYKLAAHEKKEYIRQKLFLNPEKCARVIDAYNKEEISPFDLNKDIEYRVANIFKYIKRTGLLDFLMHSQNGIGDSYEIAVMVLDIFRDWVENNKGWEQILLSPSAQREKTVQKLIHLCGKKICEDHDFDFTFEPNEGPGPADIKISRGAKDKTIIEVKLNSNPNYLHGFEEQILTYEKAEKTNKGIYVYIKVEEHKMRDSRIQQVYESKKTKEKNCPLLYVIDSMTKISASKRN
ncbi:hypothetical protein [Butyrivibrio sp.]|uniref:hypothetical protein n=1 Tax=Butyrivibrio sp. TaxID=28121 RepID=UPI0025BEB158|nr:hypothetical protein [Butyrivibrio sp.]